MILGKNNRLKTVHYPYNWAVDYTDGTHMLEYEQDTDIKNDFYKIEQDKVERFGLYGNGQQFYFNNSDGSLMLDGRRLDIGYEAGGKLYMLTINENKKDLITYKDAYVDYSNIQGEQSPEVSSINFGYKTVYSNENLNINFQPIVSLPFGESAYVQVKIMSEKYVDGYLVFYSRNREVERFHAPLEAGLSGQMSWTIKRM